MGKREDIDDETKTMAAVWPLKYKHSHPRGSHVLREGETASRHIFCTPSTETPKYLLPIVVAGKTGSVTR